MYSFFFFLILFYQTTLASIYNEQCSGSCDLPGLICVNKKCKCDPKIRLFWTGARCAECPDKWTLTETACITYHIKAMSWDNAEEKCRSMKSELISLPNRDKIRLIYNGTYGSNQKEQDYKAVGWISGRATDLSGYGKYEWVDKSIPSFNSKSDWWCKRSDTAALGYEYRHDEPTKMLDFKNIVEECLTYRRGLNKTEFICLDDRHCYLEFPFFCELSEYTAKLYLGPPPSPKKKNKLFMIILIGGILALLLLALCGLFICLKRRKTKEVVSKPSATNITETTVPAELPDPIIKQTPPPKVDLTPQKPKRPGFSKQQFDEFD